MSHRCRPSYPRKNPLCCDTKIQVTNPKSQVSNAKSNASHTKNLASNVRKKLASNINSPIYNGWPHKFNSVSCVYSAN